MPACGRRGVYTRYCTLSNQGLSEDDALRLFYNSSVAKLMEDDSMGLYGQSALYLYSLLEEELSELPAAGRRSP